MKRADTDETFRRVSGNHQLSRSQFIFAAWERTGSRRRAWRREEQREAGGEALLEQNMIGTTEAAGMRMTRRLQNEAMQNGINAIEVRNKHALMRKTLKRWLNS
jgi:hypothetical protein